MEVLKVVFLIVNPLLLAFIASAIVGATMKNFAAILMIKRVVSLSVYAISFLLYYYFVYILKGVAMYLAMFAPLAITMIFIIVSIIVVPKEKTKEQSKKDLKMTAWGSMFPNDIDNDR